VLSALLFGGPWAWTRLPFDEVTVVMAPGEPAAIPGTTIRVSYSETSAGLAGRGAIPVREYGIIEGAEWGKATEVLVGQQLGPWTVTRVRIYDGGPGLFARWLGLHGSHGPKQVATLVRR
jgi:hypothetical protein